MRYRTIVADPPWDVKAGPGAGPYKVENGTQVWNDTRAPSRDLAFPPMSLEAIQALQVRELADDDAHLYLWTTNGFLPHAFGVIAAWGFTYSTTIVWAKTPFGKGLGGKWRITTEYLLHATRGSLAATGRNVGTWFHVKREYDERGKPQHSRKPAVFLDLIEQVSPGPYLELFARRQRLGWDTWGDEALEHVNLETGTPRTA